MLIAYVVYSLSGEYIDRSQTIAEAQEHGAPSTNKAWKLEEYVMFFSYLSDLPEDVDYPMLSSHKSSVLFNAFVTSLEKNLDKTVSDEQNFLTIIKLKGICQNTLKLYIDKDLNTHKYTNEIAHLYGIQIKVLADMLHIAHNMIGSDKEDKENTLRLHGLELMKQGAAVQISVVLDLLSESDSLKNNQVLLAYFKEHVPNVLNSFDQKRKNILKQRMIEVSDKVRVQYTKKLLRDIANTI